jgi:PAS domain S-box-containing protein
MSEHTTESGQSTRAASLDGAALDAIQDPFYVIDAGGRLVRWNESYRETVGYSDETLASIEPLELIAPEDRERAAAAIADVLEDGQDVTLELGVLPADGDPIPHEVKGSPVRDDEGAVVGLSGIARDISERKARERELHNLTERLNLALEGAGLGVWDWTIETGEVTFDDRWAEMLGYDREELTGHYETWARLVHPDDLAAAETAIGAHFDGATDYYECDYRMRTKGGDWKWIRDLGKVFDRDAAGNPVRAVGIHQDVTAEKEREQELELYEALLDAVGEGVYVLDDQNRITSVNEAFLEMTGYDREEVLGTFAAAYTTEAAASEALEMRREMETGEREAGVLEVPIECADRTITALARFSLLPQGDESRYVGVLRDITERKERERTLRQQRDELETVDRINALVQETIRGLTGETSRDGIEGTICDRLAASDLYEVAWVGEPDPRDRQLTARTATGTDADALQELRVPLDDGGVCARAFREGEVTMTDGPVSDPLAAALDGRSQGSVAAVPLGFGDTIHGVLVVAGPRESFSEGERQAFAMLGETVGFAVAAVQNRRLLLSDTVTELEFRVPESDVFFVQVAEAFDCECRLDGVVPAQDGALHHYITVDGAPPEEVEQLAAEADTVENCRLIEHHGDEGLFEVVMAAPGLRSILDSGATPVRIVATPEEGRVVIRTPDESAVRPAVATLESVHGRTELVGKQAVEQPVTPGFEFQRDLGERLTDRQHSVLQAAYHAGYFDWPRGSTAEEVAASLDISSATLHQHLRAAQDKLLSAYLESPPDA